MKPGRTQPDVETMLLKTIEDNLFWALAHNIAALPLAPPGRSTRRWPCGDGRLVGLRNQQRPAATQIQAAHVTIAKTKLERVGQRVASTKVVYESGRELRTGVS